jgi:hypothetical protein
VRLTDRFPDDWYWDFWVMQRFMSRVAIERALGAKPHPMRALAASALAGAAMAGITYRFLRSGGDD